MHKSHIIVDERRCCGQSTPNFPLILDKSSSINISSKRLWCIFSPHKKLYHLYIPDNSWIVNTWRLDLCYVHTDADEEHGVGEGCVDATIQWGLPLFHKPGNTNSGSHGLENWETFLFNSLCEKRLF